MNHKTFGAIVKAAGSADGLAEGQFRALVSVFGVKDSYGDVVIPGAFTDTLAEWKGRGDPIPVFWSHRLDDPDFCIGELVDAKETADGLEVLGQVDVDAAKGLQAYRLMKGRRVTQFSFSYDVIEAGWAKRENAAGDPEEYFELRKLKLYEVGPTLIGANQETDLLAVKAASEHVSRWAADVKAGRVLSTKNESTLREALTSLQESATNIESVLAAVTAGEADDSKAIDSRPGNAEDRGSDKAEDLAGPSPVERSALLSIELADLAG